MRSVIIAASILLAAVAFIFTITRQPSQVSKTGQIPAQPAQAGNNDTAQSQTETPDTRLDVLIPASNASRAPALGEGMWINSDPLMIEDLRGRVVLVDFWTYDCVNCRNTLPTLKRWDESYRGQGLTIVGVHTPEFEHEKELKNLREQVKSLGIRYPVVTDDNKESWNAYNIQAWPTILILDKQGRIRWTHIGEGMYEEQEKVIKKLLAE